MDNKREIIPGDFFKHFTGKLYQIRNIAYHSENNEKMVVYQAMYDDFKIYVRPYEMFISEVDYVKYPDIKQKYRFEKVEAFNQNNFLTNNENNHTEKQVYDEYDYEEESQVDHKLIEFLDAKTFQEKLNILTSMKNNLNDKLINDIALSMDVEVPKGSIEKRYESLRNCILTKIKFERVR